MSRRLPLTLLAAGLAAGALTAPAADAAWTTIGSDLSQPSTISHSDPNDVVWWPSAVPKGTVAVPVKGQAIKLRLKGGIAVNAQQYARGEAFDKNFDVFHFVVLREAGDGTWRAKWSSQDLNAPRIGDGATPDTVTEFKSGAGYPLCVEPGDRIGIASVGGYVPGILERGVPYQTFASAPGSSISEYFNGPRHIQLDPSMTDESPTVLRAANTHADEELNLQVTVGTGGNARYTCGGSAPKDSEAGDLPEIPDTPAGGGGSTGGGATTPATKPPMASPLNKKRKLGKDRKVSVSVTCRPDGAPCAGTIELRVHKKRIALGKYAGLAPGKTGTYKVKLSKKGVYFVNADSDRKMLTTVVVKATGGRSAGGKMYILPAKRKRK